MGSPSPAQPAGPVFPVSVKGVVIYEHQVLLAPNERQEWELPGGRAGGRRDPEACVAREIAEETTWQVKIRPRPLDVWVYQPLPEVLPDRRVVVVTYGCATTVGELECSSEHREVALIPWRSWVGCGCRMGIAARSLSGPRCEETAEAAGMVDAPDLSPVAL